MSAVEVRYTPGDWLVSAGPACWPLVRPPVDASHCWRLVSGAPDREELLRLLAGADLALVERGAATDLTVQGAARVEMVDHRGEPRTVGSGRHRVERPLAAVRLLGGQAHLSVTFAPTAPVVEEPAPDTRQFDRMFGATYHPVAQDEFAAAPPPPQQAPPPPQQAPPPLQQVPPPLQQVPPPPQQAPPSPQQHQSSVLSLADVHWAVDTPDQPVPSQPALRQPAPRPVPVQPLGGLDDELTRTVMRNQPENPGPTVTAVRCIGGHLNPPAAQTCRACGSAVQAQAPFETARPILGRLLLPDGDAIALDRGVILGRAPGMPDPADPNRPHHVKLRSPEGDISRKHVEIRLDGWHVLAVDLESSNGTFVSHAGEQPTRIPAGLPVRLAPGASVHLNEAVVIRFEAAS